jgi:diguanylate cyclase (GGDEF)-like protein
MLQDAHTNTLEKVIDCLGDDRNFYDIASDIMEYIESDFNTSHAYILRRNFDEESYAVIKKYDRDGKYKDFTVIKREYLKLCDKEMLYATADMKELSEELAIFDARCLVSIPIYVNKLPVMHMLIMDNERRKFSEDEIAYLKSVGKVMQSIADSKLSKNQMASAGSTLKAVLTNIGSGVVVFDAEHRSVLFRNMMAEESEENVRVLNDAIESVYEDGRILIPKRTQEFFDAQSGLWFDVNFSKIEWLDGREVILVSSNDTTLKKKNSAKSAFQAQNDFLTGLYNRMRFEMDLKKIIEQTVKNNETGALLYIDMDNFKNINDSLGHDYGDALLKQIGIILQATMGLRNHVYRMGGDEFIAIVTPENYSLLDNILSSVTTSFNKSWYLIDSECYCTMSMGVVKFPEYGKDVNTLTKKADIAMYNAKRSGKNRYAFYSEEASDGNTYHNIEIEMNMRQAVEADCDEFMVYYQPIVNTTTNKVYGCESLIRWDNRNLGFMNPGEFIPLAEYLGLINEIGDYVLENACRQCKEWNEKYNPDFRTNINLSVVQLTQPDVVQHITSIIMGTGVNPHNITLEITESMAINDMQRVINITQGFKKMGMRIALDDFGTGYSSLSYIRQLDFDIIKIDKSFIDDIITDEYEKAFVKLIVDLSKQLGSKVCVEGVETKEQYELLKNLNADMIQGYYFSKPVPAQLFENKFFIE